MSIPHSLGRRGLAVSVSTAVALASHGRTLLGDNGSDLSSGTRVAYILVSVALVIIAGIAAGLTLGLLSLDRVDLEVLRRTGTPREVWLVSQVEPLISNPHWLLVSLLLINAAAFEALPIFLDRLLNPVAAILISVTAILLFAEILPQAVCKRYGLQIGAYSSWLVRAIMWLTSPISWPISKVLDWLLGEETALFRRAELRALVTMHAEDSTGESMLTAEEVTVIHGALDMANKTAEVAMTPLEKVFMVSADAILDRELLGKILEHGHSRIPVYEGTDKKNIIGLILVKELVLADLDKGLKVRECRLREIDHIVADTPLYSVLELFRFKRRHMAALTKGQEGSVHLRASLFASAGDKSVTMGELGSLKDETVGIITIEDVIEELLQHEIVDETDVYIDNTQTETVGPRTAAQPLPPKLSKYISYRKKRGELSARPSPSKPQNRPAVVAAAAAGAYAAIRKASVPPPDVAQWVGPVSVPSRPQSSATGVLPPLDDAEVTVGVPGSKKEGKGATGEGGVPAPQPPPPPPDIQ